MLKFKSIYRVCTKIPATTSGVFISIVLKYVFTVYIYLFDNDMTPTTGENMNIIYVKIQRLNKNENTKIKQKRKQAVLKNNKQKLKGFGE